jgi:hypothetical protein
MSRKIYHSEVRLASFCMDALRPQRCARTSVAMMLCLWPVGRHGETVSQVGWDAKGVLGKFPRIMMKRLTNILKSVCLVAVGYIVSLNHCDRQVIDEMVFGNQIRKCLQSKSI